MSSISIKKNVGVLPLVEIFHSIQGEGYYTGTVAWFIRLAGCSVGCHWCDSKNSWNANEHPLVPLDKIVKKITKPKENMTNSKWVVVTGGEPLEHDLTSLTMSLKKAECNIILETSGAAPLTGDWDWVTCSPKKFKPPRASVLKRANELKVVIYHPSDLVWAASFIPFLKNDCRLSLQPEWSKRDTITPLIVNYVKNNPQWHISLQTHKYMNIE